ncbi:MAG: hypothetical protein KBF26_12325 [Opitutaceae bacterium]|nr:hypothetical protein [Opitutaceae bacterium]
MKPRCYPFVLSLLFITLVAPMALSAKDKAPAEANEKDTKKNITVVVVTATPLAAHDAALQALAGIGCEIKKDTADLIEGKRSNKIGLAVGSGGEKLFVAIKDLGEGQTEVKVTTKKTMLGIVGQKHWNDEVAKQIADTVK